WQTGHGRMPLRMAPVIEQTGCVTHHMRRAAFGIGRISGRARGKRGRTGDAPLARAGLACPVVAAPGVAPQSRKLPMPLSKIEIGVMAGRRERREAIREQRAER